MRNTEDDIELRSLVRNLAVDYNNAHLDRFKPCNTYTVLHNFKDSILHVWKTFLSYGRVFESDKDIIHALSLIPCEFWPNSIYLEFSLVVSEQPVRRKI